VADGKSVKSCVIYQKKNKNSFRSPTLASLRRSRPKSATASSRQCSQNATNFIQIGFTSGEVIAERVNTIETRDRVNPIFGEAVACRRVRIANILSDILDHKVTKHNHIEF